MRHKDDAQAAWPNWPQGFLMDEALASRPLRDRDLLAEIRAMNDLARQLARYPDGVFNRLVDLAVELCDAGSAGVSLLEQTLEGEAIFRWRALAGHYKPYVGGFTPRNFSPCGICLDQGRPILLSRPQRVFDYLNETTAPPIVEGLVLPLHGGAGRALGTIWIMSHDDERRFDAADVDVMTRLATFTALGLELSGMIAEKDHLYRAAEREIAERKRADEALRGALRDKEVLLRELQHRTKNNLQVITSLLSLKARETPHEEARRDIEDVRKRVQTLAVVHDQLLRFRSVDRIELAAYLRELCTKLLDFAEMDPEKIALDLTLEEVTVSTDTAVPLGLIVNEIVSNSLEHAFPEGWGTLQVRLSRAEDGTATLVIADNGPGIPADAKTGLGRDLIRGLAMQIKAEIAIEAGHGTRYTLTFSA